MINLRYHIVSITAVFLALGIGLAFGAAFIDSATVERLDRNLEAIERQNDELRADRDRRQDRIDGFVAAERELRQQGIPQLLAGHLEGVPVLVLAVRGVDEDLVQSTVDAVAAAGAELGGVLWLTDRLALDDDGEVADMASVLQLPSADAARLRSVVATRLGTLFAAAADSTESDDEAGDDEPGDEGLPTEPTLPVEPVPEPPLLAALRAASFLELDPPAVAPEGFTVVPEAGLRLVTVSGPGADLADADVLVPVLERFSRGTVPNVGGPIAVAAQEGPDPNAEATDEFDPAAERVRFVGLLRGAEGLRDRVTTVDDLEAFPGLVAVLLGLEQGAAGRFGHYGVGEGAQSLLPPAPSAEPG